LGILRQQTNKAKLQFAFANHMLAPGGVLNENLALRAATHRWDFLVWIIDYFIWAVLELFICIILDGTIIIPTEPVIARVEPGSLAIPAKPLFFIIFYAIRALSFKDFFRYTLTDDHDFTLWAALCFQLLLAHVPGKTLFYNGSF